MDMNFDRIEYDNYGQLILKSDGIRYVAEVRVLPYSMCLRIAMTQ